MSNNTASKWALALDSVANTLGIGKTAGGYGTDDPSASALNTSAYTIGLWHYVEILDTSISIIFNGFNADNWNQKGFIK